MKIQCILCWSRSINYYITIFCGFWPPQITCVLYKVAYYKYTHLFRVPMCTCRLFCEEEMIFPCQRCQWRRCFCRLRLPVAHAAVLCSVWQGPWGVGFPTSSLYIGHPLADELSSSTENDYIIIMWHSARNTIAFWALGIENFCTFWINFDCSQYFCCNY